MNKFFLIALAVFFASCKEQKKEVSVTETAPKQETVEIENTYPENLVKVFNAHGGLNKWKQMQFLEFTMPKPDGDEVTTTNLYTRKSLIKTPNHAIGFDGENVWLQKETNTEFKGYSPKFYYNLMFYFYAMPFVLADDGIVYGEAKPLEFEGKTYPGISVSYNAGVGESPEDEYVLYYNPETYRMEWLGYTVTFFTQEKEQQLHFRRYSEWQNVNGLLLPANSIRYNYENNLPTTIHSENKFVNVKITSEKPADSLFEKPANAEIVTE